MRTVNITLKLQDREYRALEKYLIERFEVIKSKIVPDTEALYESDPAFRKLVKAEKEARRVKEIYINENNV